MQQNFGNFELTLSGQAQVFDMQKRREEKHRQYSLYLEAMEGIHGLRSQIADYDFFMNVIALEIEAEKLAELDFNPQQQLSDDLLRLNAFVDALEKIVDEHRGISLEIAFHLLKRQAPREIMQVIDYLALTDCPFLAKMHEILHPESESLVKQA